MLQKCLTTTIPHHGAFTYAPVDPANRSTSSWGNCVASAIWESVSFPKAIKAVAVRRADSIRLSSNFFSPNFSISSHMVCTPSVSSFSLPLQLQCTTAKIVKTENSDKTSRDIKRFVTPPCLIGNCPPPCSRRDSCLPCSSKNRRR